MNYTRYRELDHGRFNAFMLATSGWAWWVRWAISIALWAVCGSAGWLLGGN